MKGGLNNRFHHFIRGAFSRDRLSLLAFGIVILSVAYSNYYNKFWNERGRIIAYDVISYYQYLPAVFIYHDLSMKFIEKDPGYFSSRIWAGKTETGRYVGRMTMGLAVMFSPFFIPAHLLAGPLGFETDGYSPPYKVALILASIIYLAIGLLLLRAFLRRYFPDTAVALTLLLVGLATNLYFYTVIEPTMSHVFSFCLFAWFMLLLQRWLGNPSLRRTIILGFVSGLIMLVRPSNGIILILIALWEVDGFTGLKQRLIFLFREWQKVLLLALLILLSFFPQLLYWKFASGHWFTYTYNDEGFFFNNPQFISGMFSYRKGWLVYTPVMVFSLAGLVVLFLRMKRLFYPVFLFTLINLYIVFSWWSWWYGGGFGQRALIESYAILAVPMAAFITWIFEKRWLVQIPFFLLAGWFIFLNIFQTRQYYFGSIHWEGMTREAYWDSFLHYRPSDKFQKLIRYLDIGKAKQGIYENRPVEPEKVSYEKDPGYKTFILQVEANIRSDSSWMKNVREKAHRWGVPVDTVIRRDAKWLWEQQILKDEQ